MQLSQILDTIQQRCQFNSPEDALNAARATLETLNERLTGNEPRDLGAELPEPLSQYLDREGSGERFSAEEFCSRVASREGVATEQASEHAKAVIWTLREAVSRGEMEDVLQQLPEDYSGLFGMPGETRQH